MGMFWAISLIVLGVLIAAAATIVLAYGFWTFAKNHKQQPKYQKFLTNAFLLALFPAALTIYLVYTWLNVREWSRNDFIIGVLFELLWSLGCIHLLVLVPICRGHWPHVKAHSSLLTTVVLALAAGLSTMQQGIWDTGGLGGVELLYRYSHVQNRVVGWEALNDTHSLISMKLSNENCPQVDLITNCTWLDDAQTGLSNDDDDYVWSTLGARYGLLFTCSDGASKNYNLYDDDGANAADDDDAHYFEKTYSDDSVSYRRPNTNMWAVCMLVNNRACTADWMTTGLAKKTVPQFQPYDYYEASDETRFGKHALIMSIVTTLLSTFLLRQRRRRQEQDLQRDEETAEQASTSNALSANQQPAIEADYLPSMTHKTYDSPAIPPIPRSSDS